MSISKSNKYKVLVSKIVMEYINDNNIIYKNVDGVNVRVEN